MAHPDFCIAGAGVIGLSLALELRARGASVVVLEARSAVRQTSFAAAGMLAVEDPQNPAELLPLSRLSAELYPEFLDRVGDLAGMRVPFQTNSTLEGVNVMAETRLEDARALVPALAAEHPPLRLLLERSVDPRQVGAALLEAARALKIDLREETELRRVAASTDGVRVMTSGETVETGVLVDCMGTWSPAPVRPRKGQMLAVVMPAGLELTTVIRTHEVYIVPRTDGPNAGLAILGATVEDVGFDLSVHPADVLRLNARAVALVPALAEAKFQESWAGLRPGTADGLPLLGATARQPRYVLATGHFRNGILLAPATARVMAEHLLGEQPAIDLAAFAPDRFTQDRPA